MTFSCIVNTRQSCHDGSDSRSTFSCGTKSVACNDSSVSEERTQGCLIVPSLPSLPRCLASVTHLAALCVLPPAPAPHSPQFGGVRLLGTDISALRCVVTGTTPPQ
ncbi:hypothetical protein E2C01_088478 [Portunus trituberculatus]|uniref:Uncharacterized protein n=1 Tax=Portunus trituberculatus TaxID=210409 RepID=A0A5B7JG42_PORTR|nr:hypothetical protein [Portunus trituberculatus]